MNYNTCVAGYTDNCSRQVNYNTCVASYTDNCSCQVSYNTCVAGYTDNCSSQVSYNTCVAGYTDNCSRQVSYNTCLAGHTDNCSRKVSYNTCVAGYTFKRKASNEWKTHTHLQLSNKPSKKWRSGLTHTTEIIKLVSTAIYEATPPTIFAILMTLATNMQIIEGT